jgi:hypothetical protein
MAPPKGVNTAQSRERSAHIRAARSPPTVAALSLEVIKTPSRHARWSHHWQPGGPCSWQATAGRWTTAKTAAGMQRKAGDELPPEGVACQRDSIQLMSAARRLRIDDVGCLPQRAGYPVPKPHLLKLLHQLGEQLTQRRQVKHPWLAIAIHHPSSLRCAGRAARLVGDVAGDSVGQARSIGKADAVAAQVNARAGRRIGSVRWPRVLRHWNHPSSGGWPT